MLALFYYEGIDFEWNDEKAERNWAKHRVTFMEAAKVFIDPHVQFIEDEGDYGEMRECAIGRINYSTTLYVVFVDLTTRFRIISARPATRAEIRQYEDDK